LNFDLREHIFHVLMIYAKKKQKKEDNLPRNFRLTEKSKGGICKLVKSSSSDLVTWPSEEKGNYRLWEYHLMNIRWFVFFLFFLKLSPLEILPIWRSDLFFLITLIIKRMSNRKSWRRIGTLCKPIKFIKLEREKSEI